MLKKAKIFLEDGRCRTDRGNGKFCIEEFQLEIVCEEEDGKFEVAKRLLSSFESVVQILDLSEYQLIRVSCFMNHFYGTGRTELLSVVDEIWQSSAACLDDAGVFPGDVVFRFQVA